MRGRWGRPVVAAASLFVLTACGGGGDQAAVVEPVVPQAPTSTTVPPFDAAALPPHPLADQADFDAIVRELFAIRDDAFRYLDVERLEAVYAAECPCREEANEIRSALREGYRIIGDEVEINTARLHSIVQDRGVLLDLVVDLPAVRRDGGAIDETKRSDIDDQRVRLALGHTGHRWVIVGFELEDA